MLINKRFVMVLLPACASFLSTSETDQQAKTYLRGCIKTAQGSPVKGIEVKCFYIDPKYDYEFVWQVDSQLSNEQGQYRFHVLSNREYRIVAGGRKATIAQSKRFMVSSNMEVLVEDLIVTPAAASLSGKILNSDGSPASGLHYSCQSENFRLFRPSDYPKTDPNGSFNIPALLSNEPVDFWVIPSPNNVQIWSGIMPDGKDVLLRLDTEKFLSLPPDWKKYFYIEGLARGIRRTKVQKRINFTVGDLQGNQVSLDSDLFKGKVILVNIFGTWCGSCKQEIPHLVNFKKKYENRGLEIIGVAFERNPEEIAREKVREFVEKWKINYSVLFGGQEKRVNVLSTIKGLDHFSGYPTTIFIGRDGDVKDVKVNFVAITPEITDWQVDQFEKIILNLLKTP
ncbi:MAG: TlpA family protein disulfide reductase [Sedimentisphaerales bacterium]|nr:TlpA family protein disulfide reductase [Sedimentisphaerales bacterium]